jgi:hypothetical protein
MTFPEVMSLIAAFSALASVLYYYVKRPDAPPPNPDPQGARRGGQVQAPQPLKEAFELLEEIKQENSRLRTRVRELEASQDRADKRIAILERRERRLIELISRLTKQAPELIEFTLFDGGDNVPQDEKKGGGG